MRTRSQANKRINVEEYLKKVESQEMRLGRVFFRGSFLIGDERIDRIYSIIRKDVNLEESEGILRIRYDPEMDIDNIDYSEHRFDRQTEVIIDSYPVNEGVSGVLRRQND
jgi:hypothetical protein